MKSEPPDMEQAEPSLQCNTGPDSSAGQAESLDNRIVRRKPRKILWAAILSLFVPGLGQVYNGQIVKGLVFWLPPYALALICAGTGLLLTFYGWVLLLSIMALMYVVAFVDAIVMALRLKAIDLKAYNRWYLYLAVVIMSAVVWDLSPALPEHFKTYRMPASSMERTLQIGDCFLVNLDEYKTRAPRRGEVIVFEYPHDTTKDFIERVIAVGGDTVEIRDKKLFLNGKQTQDSHAQFRDNRTLPAQSSPRDNLASLVVPDGSLFVMGDNRDFSHDSRFFGLVDVKEVKGKVLFIYWSDDKSRVGMSVQ